MEPRHAKLLSASPAGPHAMAYVEWGDPDSRQILICAHGLTRIGRDFDVLARSMSDRYRVICPDVVGRGRSDWLRDPLHYTVPQYIADFRLLIAQLRMTHPFAAIDWVGTSLGGLIGMGIAATPDSPIRTLVLNDVGPVIAARALGRIGDYLGADISFATFEEGLQYLATISLPFGPHSDTQWRALNEFMLVPREVDGTTRWRLHYDPRSCDNFKAAAALFPAGADTELWDLYDLIRARTLVIRGERSDLLSRETVRNMSSRGPQAASVEIAGVGHAPTLVQPDQVAIVRDFLID
ncbi:alpha/beta hydrolase [soil metagenome]